MHNVRLFIIILCTLIFCNQLTASELPGPLVETSWLQNNLDSVVVVDVRSDSKNFLAEPGFKLNKKTNKKVLVKVGGHIPGARHIPYKNIRAARNINNLKVKNLILEKGQFETLLQAAGVNNKDTIIVVTNAENGSDLNAAARMYWQIKYYGHDNVAILNGGMAQWIVDGRDISTTVSEYDSGNWQATLQREDLLATSDEVNEAIESDDVQLIDVRPLGQYLGTNNNKGHIPSAKYFPVELTTTTRLPFKFLSTQELQELATAFSANTESQVITYCNSGHMASGSWFVMHALLGNEMAALYDGSMTQWNVEKRPTVRMQFQ